MDAIVLGGAENSKTMKKMAGSRYEAQIEITGLPMINFVLDVLEKMESIEKIIVVTPDEVAAGIKGKKIWKVLPPGANMVESLNKALAFCPRGEQVLILTSDIPLITAEALGDFLQKCRERKADIYYSLVPREIIEGKYQGVKRTYVRLKEGTYTGGNVVMLDPKVVLEHGDSIRQAVALRKHPLKLCRLLGIKFFLKFLAGRLTVPEVERRVEEILKIKGAGIVSLYPEIGIDVDKPSDLQLVRAVLESKEPLGL